MRPTCGAWIDAVSEAGARGLLLDTSDKAGPGLLALLGSCRLAQLRQRAEEAGIWLAVAGGVSMATMPDVIAARPHVIGVRGAVCSGGRAGVLEVNRVVELRDAIAGRLRCSKRPESGGRAGAHHKGAALRSEFRIHQVFPAPLRRLHQQQRLRPDVARDECGDAVARHVP